MQRLAKPSSGDRRAGSNPAPSATQQRADEWPKLLWCCDHCAHWHGASYARWPVEQPPTCKIKGYGRDGKRACGQPMRPVWVAPVQVQEHRPEVER